MGNCCVIACGPPSFAKPINTNQNIAILKDAIANIGDEKVTGILAGAGRVKKNYGNVLV